MNFWSSSTAEEIKTAVGELPPSHVACIPHQWIRNFEKTESLSAWFLQEIYKIFPKNAQINAEFKVRTFAFLIQIKVACNLVRQWSYHPAFI